MVPGQLMVSGVTGIFRLAGRSDYCGSSLLTRGSTCCHGFQNLVYQLECNCSDDNENNCLYEDIQCGYHGWVHDLVTGGFQIHISTSPEFVYSSVSSM